MGKIVVNNLGKAYKTYPTKLARMREWLIPFSKPSYSQHWVLQDINFQVQPGEAVGIIGINGAGKSTLLKMITGTTQPTTGSIEITGRVAALLELGMGFHPDFTGRQNAYMAGQLLGISAAEITRLMPEIEAFAEIGDYIDQPVRVYSSGMQMRLAFSVATAHRPDVLIVDEALSVGDSYFQHKSFDRIREFRKQGTTLLIVSHDKSAIQSICDHAILLNAGKLAMQGEPEAVMNYYNAMLAEHQNQSIKQEATEGGKIQTVSGTGEVCIERVSLYNKNNKEIMTVDVGEFVILKIETLIVHPIEQLVFGYMIKDRLGQSIYGINSYEMEEKIKNLHSGQRVDCNIGFNVNLGPGSYSISVALTSSDSHLHNNYEWRDLAITFDVVNRTKKIFAGCLWLEPEIELVRKG